MGSVGATAAAAKVELKEVAEAETAAGDQEGRHD